MAVPGRAVGEEPSPHVTVRDVIDPSGSVDVKPTVTADPVGAGFGEMPLIVTVGAWSFMVAVVVPDPGPALFVAVTVIRNDCVFALPVEE